MKTSAIYSFTKKSFGFYDNGFYAANSPSTTPMPTVVNTPFHHIIIHGHHPPLGFLISPTMSNLAQLALFT